MPTIGDYLIIRDDRFTLDTNGDRDIDFDFNLDNNVNLSNRPILMFDLFMPDQSGSRAFQVTINGSIQFTRSFSGFRSETHHEIINSGVIIHGRNNIEFEITSGSGNLQIGDIVLLHQRDV
jgi:hypothetical protein